MNDIQYYRKQLNEYKTKRKILKGQYKEKNSTLKQYNIELDELKQAQEIIQLVAQETQNKLKIFITDIVNLGLDTVPFEKKPDSFDIDFIIRRNQTECDLYCLEDGKKMSLLLSYGGGVLDIISFCLRIACWSLQTKNKSNTLIFDEPFKNLNDPGNLLGLKEYVSEMVKKISDKLNIQMIIIGSNDNFTNIADKIFKVKVNKKEQTVIEEVLK